MATRERRHSVLHRVLHKGLPPTQAERCEPVFTCRQNGSRLASSQIIQQGRFWFRKPPPQFSARSFVLDDFAQRVARHPRRTAQACVRLPPCCFFCVLLPQHHPHSQVRVCRSDREARHVRGCSLLLLRLWINHRVEEVTEHLQVGSSRAASQYGGLSKKAAPASAAE